MDLLTFKIGVVNIVFSFIGESIFGLSGLRFVLSKRVIHMYLDPTMHGPTVAFRIR